MNNVIENPSAEVKSRAFTLIELLVVVAIIGILAALLLSALSSAKDRATRVNCLSNIKQVDMLLLMYGQENNDRLPSSSNCMLLPPVLVDMINRTRIPPRVLFDPGLKTANMSPEKTWDYMTGGAIGYFHTLPGVALILQENINAKSVPLPIQMGVVMLPAPVASERVLVAGPIMGSGGNAALRYTYGYFSLGTTGTAHMDSKHRFPTGDNVGMLDGSAKWRKFANMIPRSETNTTSTGAIWW